MKVKVAGFENVDGPYSSSSRSWRDSAEAQAVFSFVSRGQGGAFNEVAY